VIGRQRVDDPLEREHPGRDRADQNGQHDGDAGAALCTRGAQEERRGERDGGQAVADVVDQVGQQRHAAGRDVDGGLDRRGDRQHGERDADDAQRIV
jgi:hypothetical protein